MEILFVTNNIYSEDEVLAIKNIVNPVKIIDAVEDNSSVVIVACSDLSNADLIKLL